MKKHPHVHIALGLPPDSEQCHWYVWKGEGSHECINLDNAQQLWPKCSLSLQTIRETNMSNATLHIFDAMGSKSWHKINEGNHSAPTDIWFNPLDKKGLN